MTKKKLTPEEAIRISLALATAHAAADELIACLTPDGWRGIQPPRSLLRDSPEAAREPRQRTRTSSSRSPGPEVAESAHRLRRASSKEGASGE